MEFFKSLRSKLAGYKTYLVAVAGILGTVIAWISGEVELAEAVKAIFTAILAMTVRAGVAKAEPAAKQ